LPIEKEEYQEMIGNKQTFRAKLDEQIEAYPELFPSDIQQGYKFNGMMPVSKKMPEVRLRRICLTVRDAEGKQQVFTIVPSFVLPYMVGYTDEVEKALFAHSCGVPYWGLTYLFGRDDTYWYRLAVSFGRNNIVGTTIKSPANLPDHVLADEKHVHFNGEKAYVATTVADDCVLGASVALNPDTPDLTEAYGYFKTEAQQVRVDYAPQTVNTDGWTATQNAWLALFTCIVIIPCFLHLFLKIRSRAKRLACFPEIKSRIWDIYRATTPTLFLTQLDALHVWAHQTIQKEPVLKTIDKFCAKAPLCLRAFAFPGTYRTSNMLDRHMDHLARCLDSAHHFHGHWSSAELFVRAWALFHNFRPYCPRADVRAQQGFLSPAHKLNGRVYHANWLHNLLVSTSMGGVPC
jgi:hypothetical protein